MLHDLKVSVTTDALGDGTGTPEFWPGMGRLEAVVLDFGTLDANMDITITSAGHGVTQTLLSKTNQGAADAIWYPRVKGVDAADGSALADGDGNAYQEPIVDGPPTVTVADGGNVQAGVFHLLVRRD